MIASHGSLHTVSRIGLLLLILTGVWIVVDGIRSSKFHHAEAPQIVTLIDEVEPEDEEPVIEPEQVEIEEYFEEVDVPELDNMEQIDDLLGLDDDAFAGFDQFGLVSKRGGRDLIGSDSTGSAIKFDLARVKSLIEQHLQTALGSKMELRRKSYSIILKFWIDSNGFIENVKFMNTTGDKQIDRSIERILRSLPPFTSELKDVPQPVTLQIITRGLANS